MKYDIITTCNLDFYNFLRAFIVSLYETCDNDKINRVIVCDTGMNADMVSELKSKGIEVYDSNVSTRYSGDWKEGWHDIVESKTRSLYNIVQEFPDTPKVMIDSDCMFVRDFFPILETSNTFSLCYRRNRVPTIPYLASFVAIHDCEAALPFIETWMTSVKERRNADKSANYQRAVESPLLGATVAAYQKLVSIQDINEPIVSCYTKKQSEDSEDVKIVHFKSEGHTASMIEAYRSRVDSRGFGEIFAEYQNKYKEFSI